MNTKTSMQCAKAIAGCHKIESKSDPGLSVVSAALPINLDYADSWLCKAAAFDMPEGIVLAWASLKDEETRAKEVELVRKVLLEAMQLSEVS